MSLIIDRVFPQHFRNYSITASNSQGTALLHFQLAPRTFYTCFVNSIVTFSVFRGV